MKKVHEKLNKMLAVTLSTLMVCLPLPVDHVLADSAGQDDSAGTVAGSTLPDSGGEMENTLPGSTEGEAENELPGSAKGDTENELPGSTEGETENQLPGETEGNTENQLPGETEGNTENVLPGETEGNTENVLPGETEGNTENVLPGGTNGEAGDTLPGDTEVNTPTESEAAAAGPYIFSYDGETFEGTEASDATLNLTPATQWEKKGLVLKTGQDVSIPMETAIVSGTAVFDIELCTAGSAKQSVVFRNSKGDNLFALVCDGSKYYLAADENGAAMVELGAYPGNIWSRLRTEFYLDKSGDGGLNFKVSVAEVVKREDGEQTVYTADVSGWREVKTITQEDLNTANGTVTEAIDGSADHPFDLGAVQVFGLGKRDRWLGDIFLYAVTGAELVEQPGEQTPGTDFVPGDAAVKVTYATGAEETVKLADLLYGVDYTTKKSDAGNYVICYGGIEMETTAEVPAATVTGIKVKVQPTKTTYKIGETFDATGLVVEAVKSDDTTEELAENAYTISAVDTSEAGYKDVTVTYTENTDFTDSFKIKVEDNQVNMKTLFAYTGEAANLEELGLAGDTDKVELSTEAVKGNESQHLYFSGAGTVTKSWDAVNTGVVKMNVEFYHNGKSALYRICDKDGNVLINFGQFGSGNLNLYEGQDTAGDPSTILSKKKNNWVRLETEIDLDASNAEQKLKFTTNVYYKENYTDAEWQLGGTVTEDNYVTTDIFTNANGCATDSLVEFSVGSMALQSKDNPGVSFDNMEVLVPAAAESQSFVYIDAEDITDLELEASGEGVLNIHSGEVAGNATNKLSIVKGSVTKTIKNPIASGKVVLETVAHPNGKIQGIQILDSKGNNLITYSQQTSGNLNMYYGNGITGSSNAGTIAEKGIISNNKWVKVKTEIDLDASNKTGVLEFTTIVQYKDSYTDEEWKNATASGEEQIWTNKLYLDKGLSNGAAVDGFSTFDIGSIKITSDGGTSYVDDIKFDDGNGINGVVTITDKVLKSIAITTEAATKEFPQDSKVNTEGLVLTGTYDVTYSDGKKEEKIYKITKYDVECDTSKVVDSTPVTIKVTDHDKVFTATYNVKIVPKADGSYVTFSYTDEEGVAQTGFGGSKISVAGGDTYGNNTNKIKLDKGESKMTLAAPCTTGTVHFETEFLTTATSKASLFLRMLNSEGKPMVDIAQYGSGNLNLYIDKKTSGTDGAMAGQFGGLPVKQWAKLSVDIDLDQTKEEGHLVFDAIVWTKDNYAGDWSVHAEFNQDLYLNSTTAPTTTGSASTDATVFDIASIEMVNSNGTNYYDNMFFEAIRGDVAKELVDLWIEKPADKTDYTVGDGLNRAGLVLMGKYKYTFPNGDVKEKEAEVTKYDISFDNTQPGEEVPVYLTAGDKTVSYTVIVRPNTSLDDVEEYLVDYINNRLVNLDGENVIHINKRQVRLPVETAKGEALSWEVTSGNADVTENILTVVPSTEESTEVAIKVTLNTINNDGDPVSFFKMIHVVVPKESGNGVDDSLTTEESIRYAVTTLYERGLLDGQANLADVEAVMASLGRDITTEEIAVILVNMFDIDTTYADTKISRKDVEDDAWYSKYVKAAFQLSVETRDSREGKENYGIGKGISRKNLVYMIDRIVHIDQTTMPSDYTDRMFE